MHRGLRSILNGIALSAIGTSTIYGLLICNETPFGRSNQYLLFLVGAFSVLMTFTGPALIILDFKRILHWIGMQFGQRALMLCVFLLAMASSCIALLAVIASIAERRLHAHAIAGTIAAAGSLWMIFIKLFINSLRHENRMDTGLTP